MKQDKKTKRMIKNKILLRLGEILQDSDGIISLVKLNFLFILTSVIFLPPVFIFTAGPAFTAILNCTNRMVKTGYQPDVVHNYMAVYKKYFRKAALPGAIMTVLSGFFGLGLYIYITMASENIIFIPLASVSLLMLIITGGISVHLFPALADENNDSTLKENISVAASLFIEKLPATVITVAICAVFIAVMVLLLPATLPLLLTIAFSVPGLAAAFAHSTPEW